MITGAIKSQIVRIWGAFWAGGISNPLEVVEQITYLLFIKRLDDLQTLEDKKAELTQLGQEVRLVTQGLADVGAGRVFA
ncbi:type I restriction-modification system subunit M N-terminal domain-containing protein [Dyella flava]|uniref:Type I restriction-modification system subunit M N-terminal domain-containing protein n=1 Tax=Dyella flava TaxID=1920170 RepID=A0ABS2K8Z7_9GAMM|nr:type I restriction-modification system subunit M N-terminal domain-containing protein [Dyella flava]MBM7127520.1 type I restriction-modification system subunit M N-terminal domain-containing protein [Dyella flava]GLQ51119.1 hypothetical protein GCM10010872_25680 [Dyella flava]